MLHANFSRCHFIITAVTWQNQQFGCAPSEDSDQPGHPPSLIRVFAVSMKKPWILTYPLSAQRRLIRLGGCPGWSESSQGAQSFCWFCHEAAHYNFWFWNTSGTSPDTFDVLVGGKEIGFGQIDALTDSSAIDRESAYDLPPPPARHSTFSSASSNTPKSVSYYYNEDNDFYDYPPQRRQDIPSSYSASSESSSVVSSAFSTDSEISPKAVKDYSPSKESKSNSDSLSKLEQIRKLLEDETDPVNILCSCLNIPNSVGALDEKLTSMIQPTESLKDASFPTIALGKPGKAARKWFA